MTIGQVLGLPLWILDQKLKQEIYQILLQRILVPKKIQWRCAFSEEGAYAKLINGSTVVSCKAFKFHQLSLVLNSCDRASR